MNIKINDIVRAKETIFGITKGREYKVTHVAAKLVYLTDDTGRREGYLAKRFEAQPVVAEVPAATVVPTAPKPKRVTPMDELSPQCQTVLKHLLKTGSITQREALMDHSVQSLTKRISDLKERGYPIDPETKNHPITGQRYVRYLLKDRAAAKKLAYPPAPSASNDPYLLAA